MSHAVYVSGFFSRICTTLARAVAPESRVLCALICILGSTFGVGTARGAIIPVGDTGVFATSFVVGNTIPGVNTLMVDGGSVLDSAAGFGAFTSVTIGSQAGVEGTATVTGAGSTIVSTGTGLMPHTTAGFLVGASGTGELIITNGGSAVANNFAVAAGFTPPTTTSTVRVDGVGSNITSASTFLVGVNGIGPGTLTATADIINGGVVNAQTSVIGSTHGSNGKLTVSGAGSALNLVTGPVPAFGRAFLNVGREQKGQVDVLAGAKVTLDAADVGTTGVALTVGRGTGAIIDGGSFANGDGTVNIDGAGSEIRLKGNRPLTIIGGQGTGVVNITNGGKLVLESIGSTTMFSNSFVGQTAGGSGTVNVTGAGSEWKAGRRLYIGANDDGAGNPIAGGTGVVNVADGGTITVAATGIRNTSVGPGGTLTGGGGTLVSPLLNLGTIAPGNSIGTLTVIGNVTLDNSGVVELELGPSGNDLLEADGTMSVDGTLKVMLLPGYNPSAGSFFDVFAAIDITETSPIYDLPGLATGLFWEHMIVETGGGEVLRLQVGGAAVPAPGSFALLALGLGMLFFGRRAASRR